MILYCSDDWRRHLVPRVNPACDVTCAQNPVLNSSGLPGLISNVFDIYDYKSGGPLLSFLSAFTSASVRERSQSSWKFYSLDCLIDLLHFQICCTLHEKEQVCSSWCSLKWWDYTHTTTSDWQRMFLHYLSIISKNEVLESIGAFAVAGLPQITNMWVYMQPQKLSWGIILAGLVEKKYVKE